MENPLETDGKEESKVVNSAQTSEGPRFTKAAAL
jgi:hypothetical protein